MTNVALSDIEPLEGVDGDASQAHKTKYLRIPLGRE
jgi:hypothetical protein